MITARPREIRLEEARKAAEACARVLREQFGVRKVYIFGSVTGESPWHSRSDIDLAVEGLAPEKYLIALSALYELLPPGLNLDLVTLEDAPPELARRISGEAPMPEDPLLALKKEIHDEILNLSRISRQASKLLKEFPGSPTFVELSAAGKLAHDFYSGVERIFERIALRLGPGLPVGNGWHTILLRGMESSVEGIRSEVIDHSLALRLLDYLRFRHLFRHTYGYELQWEKLRPLVEGIEETLTLLREQVDRFLNKLEG